MEDDREAGFVDAGSRCAPNPQHFELHSMHGLYVQTRRLYLSFENPNAFQCLLTPRHAAPKLRLQKLTVQWQLIKPVFYASPFIPDYKVGFGP